MKSGHKIIAIIPARGGSKGLPNKNILNFCGKPLISWIISSALQSKYIDEVFVTTDSEEIAKISVKAGANVPWLRPKDLAQDDSLRGDVIMHAIENLPTFHSLIYLEPTSPLTDHHDIDHALSDFLSRKDPKSMVSVTLAEKFHPEYALKLSQDSRIHSYCSDKPLSQILVNRQTLEPLYIFDGSLYISTRESFIKHREFLHDETLGYLMHSSKAIEIDNITDFKVAEYLFEMENLKNEI